MAKFDAKSFNPEVFLRYYETIESARVNRLIKAGILVPDPELARQFPAQVGGNFAVRNFVGRLEGAEDLYDGSTNITDGSLNTYQQGVVVIGRAKAFTEKDFTPSITGKNFMDNVAEQLRDYWDTKNQDKLLLILKAMFGGALSSKVVTKQLASLNVADIVDGLALQGDKSGNIRMLAMHSTVLNALKKANLAQAVKFTDVNGIQRDLGIYQWDSREIIEDDSIEPAISYAKTADVAIVAGKVYYTLSDGVYTPVAEPDVSDIGDYYEKTVAYPVYLLGASCFTYQDCGVEVPVEMGRDPRTNGGQNTLYSRERIAIAPFGISFTKNTMVKLTPSDSELALPANWAVVNDGNGNGLPLKNIPFACIVFKISGI